MPMFAWMMHHRNLGNSKSPSSRQHWNEAMHFTVELHFAKNLPTVGFQSAIVIVQLESSKSTNEPIENFGRHCLVPWIVPSLLPAANAIETFIDLCE